MKTRDIESIRTGDSVEIDFVISEADMESFLDLSGDASLIHTDRDYCRSNGFAGRVVYGGLLLAKLSGLLGTHIPGATGLSAEWKVRFKRPLYIGVPARITAVVTDVSPATRLVQLKFSVHDCDQTLAVGSVQSLSLPPTAPGQST